MVAVMFLLQELVEGKLSCDNQILSFTGWHITKYGALDAVDGDYYLP